MSIKTREELRQYWNDNINTNGAQGILGSIMNIGGIDIIDSLALNVDLTTGLSSKEDLFGVPSEDGYVLTSTVSGIRSWMKLAHQIITNRDADNAHPMSAITGLVTELNSKEPWLGNPAGDNYMLVSSAAGTRSWARTDIEGVRSVNGFTGVVTLKSFDIAEDRNLYFTESRADARVQAAINDSSTSGTTLYSSQKIQSIVSGALHYKGSWDALTNTPAITDATGVANDYYKVSVAGSQNLGSGMISFSVGDDVIHNGTIFESFGSSSDVLSVNTKTGAVVLDTDDISEGVSNLYYTDARVDARLTGVIDDNSTALDKTWSASKLDTRFSQKSEVGHNHDSAYEPKNANIQAHIPRTDNPHAVTKAAVGLSDVDNTSDINKPVSEPTQVEIDTKMEWKDAWESGPYKKNDVVRDGDFTMVANKDTTDKPAPSSVGDSYHIFDDSLAGDSAVTKQIIQGAAYTVSGPVLITGYGSYNHANQKIETYLIKDPTGASVIYNLNESAPIEEGWVYNSITPILANTPGEVFHIITVTSDPSPIATNWQSTWTYVTPQDAMLPADGVISHSVAQPETIRISKLDSGSIDRGAALLALTPGDSINVSNTQWIIQYSNDEGLYVLFEVLPASVEAEGLQQIIFQTTSASALKYGKTPGYWSANPNIQGLYSGVGYTGATLDENAYGVDLVLQGIVSSEDWDLLAFNGGGGGESTSDMDWAAIGASIDPTGDDKGFKITDGQFSVGSPAKGRETVLGGGDSYPVPLAFHFDQDDLTGLTITNAIDISEILQSDSGSTVPSFNGTSPGKSLLFGSDYPFGGVKIKSVAQSVMDRGDAKISYLINSTPTWQETPFMSTNSNFPYQQYGNLVEGRTGGSEQCRFGWYAEDGSPMGWVKTTLNINGTDYNKYWVVLWLYNPIITDGTLEQVKLHSDRWECNSDGVTEIFGKARPPKRISFHQATNKRKNPDNQDIDISADIQIEVKDNKFKVDVDDGLVFIGKLPVGVDTSVPLTLSIDYYQNGTGTGDIKFNVETVKVIDGFIYNGAALPDNQKTMIIPATGNVAERQVFETDINIHDMLIGDTLVISFYRNGSDAADTYGDAVIIAGQTVSGIFWR